MAGIGFELRKILKQDSYWSLLQAYTYAGVIGSGPWILSIFGILLIGVLSVTNLQSNAQIVQFQHSVTHLIAFSLLLTGFFTLTFTRYIADRLFEKQESLVVPNFHGALFVITLLCGLIGGPLIWHFFSDQTLLYRALMLGGLVVLGNIWVATIFLSGMREYKAILGIYAGGYSVTVLAALSLQHFGVEGLLFGFLIGQFVLLLGMMVLTLRTFSIDSFLGWDFLKKEKIYFSLVLLGLVYNLGIWIDKFLFWYHPDTGEGVIGPIRSSPIYDLPIFLAYLSIVPAMASFLVRMETDFVEQNQAFYSAIREGASLDQIHTARKRMIQSVRYGIVEILKVQFVVTLIIWGIGEDVLRWLGISELYASLLYIDVVAAGLQVMFLGVLNVFFYLDKRMIALGLTVFFLAGNIGFSAWSLHMGIPFYGYGIALALLITVLIAMYILDKKLQHLEYETFMLQ